MTEHAKHVTCVHGRQLQLHNALAGVVLRGALQPGKFDCARLVAADFYRVPPAREYRPLEAIAACAQRVDDFAGVLVDDLHHRAPGAFETQQRQPTDWFTTIVVGNANGDGPAGKLGLVVGSGIGEARPALEVDGLLLLVEPHEAVPVGPPALVVDVR